LFGVDALNLKLWYLDKMPCFAHPITDDLIINPHFISPQPWSEADTVSEATFHGWGKDVAYQNLQNDNCDSAGLASVQSATVTGGPPEMSNNPNLASENFYYLTQGTFNSGNSTLSDFDQGVAENTDIALIIQMLMHARETPHDPSLPAWTHGVVKASGYYSDFQAMMLFGNPPTMFTNVAAGQFGGMNPDQWTFVVYDPIWNTLSHVEQNFPTYPTAPFSAVAPLFFDGPASIPFLKLVFCLEETPWILNIHERWTLLEQNIEWNAASVSGGYKFTGQVPHPSRDHKRGFKTNLESNYDDDYPSTINGYGKYDIPLYVSYFGISTGTYHSSHQPLAAVDHHEALWTWDGYDWRDSYHKPTTSAECKRRFLTVGDKTMLRLDDTTPYVTAWRMDLAGDAAIAHRYSVFDPDDSTDLRFTEGVGPSHVLCEYLYNGIKLVRKSTTDAGTCTDDMVEYLSAPAGLRRHAIKRGVLWQNPAATDTSRYLAGGIPWLKIQ
jgi:hypothetical protein